MSVLDEEFYDSFEDQKKDIIPPVYLEVIAMNPFEVIKTY
jgi:hypothetical protein